MSAKHQPRLQSQGKPGQPPPLSAARAAPPRLQPVPSFPGTWGYRVAVLFRACLYLLILGGLALLIGFALVVGVSGHGAAASSVEDGPRVSSEPAHTRDFALRPIREELFRLDAELKELQSKATAGPDLGTLQTNLKNLGGEVAHLRAKLDMVSATSSSASTEKEDPTRPPLVKKLDELANRVKALEEKKPMAGEPSKPSTGGQGATADGLMREIESLRGLVTNNGIKLTEAIKTVSGKADQARLMELNNRLEQQKKDLYEVLRKQKEELEKGQKEAIEKVNARLSSLTPEPADVVILASHTEYLNVSRYLEAFRTVLFDEGLTKLRAKQHRVGLSLLMGEGKCDTYLKVDAATDADWEEARNKLRTLGEPSRATSDTLAQRGRELADRFPDKDTVNRKRRCIIVASTNCTPVPKEEFKAWEGYEAHIILIGERFQKFEDLPPERQDGWKKFCQHVKASHPEILQARDSSSQDPSVLTRLTLRLARLTEPSYPGRKEN